MTQTTRKFVASVVEDTCQASGETLYWHQVKNRAGRTWITIRPISDAACDAAESCEVLQDFLDAGKPLDRKHWTEIKAA